MTLIFIKSLVYMAVLVFGIVGSIAIIFERGK